MTNTREKLIEVLSGYKVDPPCDTCKTPIGHCNECGLGRIADYLIANGVTIQSEPLTICQQSVGDKWVSTAERLPQEKGDVCKNVILFMDDGLVTVGWLNEDRGKAYYLEPQNDFISRVPISRCTHWMPLPEPPKGE